jgi:ABC-type transport system involved in multi-copper enzyme maturation permease subunit
MSDATVLRQRPGFRSAQTGTGLSFPRVVRSEWLKLRTLRSTWLTLGFAVVVLVLAAGLIAHHVHSEFLHPQGFEDPNDRDPLTTPLRGFGVSQLVVGVLGVLAVTGEYATGTIRATFSAVPRRLPVLWAKVLVFSALTFVTMLVATLAAFFTAQSQLGSFRIGLDAPNALRVLIALAGYLALVGILGLGLGFVVRSTAGGVASLVGILLVAPGILAAINTSWSNRIGHYLPLSAGLSMFNDTRPTGGALSSSAGTIVMCIWAAAAVIAAAVLVATRDT